MVRRPLRMSFCDCCLGEGCGAFEMMQHQEIDISPFIYGDFPASRFFHFLMGKAKLVEQLVSQCPSDEPVFVVTYDEPYEPPASEQRRIRTFHYSRSSVHQGYNLGWRVAKQNQEYFKYFCSLDDDVHFTQGNYCDFLDAVFDVEPYIAVPVVPRTSKEKFLVAGASLQSGAIHDQQIMVFDKTTMNDKTVWPFVESVHEISSFVAPIIQEYFIHELYPQKVAQMNHFFVENSGHAWKESDQHTTYRVPHESWHVPRKAAFEYLTKKLGRKPSVDNDIFMRIRTHSASDFLKKKYWNNFGRAKFMRKLYTHRGEIDVSSE